jgi:tRNA 2-thiouridine synthesizing protein D
VKKIAFVVTTPPHSPLTVSSFQLIKAAVNAQDISVIGVFFYQDGVINANTQIAISSDEWQALAHWRQLKQEYNVSLHLCITAAERRGLIEQSSSNIDGSFTVSGLVELVDLTQQADRVVQL